MSQLQPPFPEPFDRWALLLLGGVLFLPFLGGAHLFDWDEINFAEAAREMVETGNYLQVQINYRPFWEKPPLFIWMQALCMKLFGVGEFAARLPNAICGIVTLQLLYGWGKSLYDRSFGGWWVLAYLGSILPHFYFKSGIIDPWFNLFIFGGIWFLWRATVSRRSRSPRTLRYLLLAGVLTGLGVLTKGPVALLLTFLLLLAYWITQRFRWFLNLKHGLLYLGMVVLVPGLWFGLDILQNGTWFTETFIDYQLRLLTTEDAGHGGFFGYHFVVLLVGCFLGSLLALTGFQRAWSNSDDEDFGKWMLLLLGVVLVVFSLVQSKIVHYSSLAYFPITYLAALAIRRATWRRRWFRWSVLLLGLLIALVPLALPFLGRNIELIAPLFSKDEFARGNIRAEVDWTGLEALVGVIFLVTLGYFFINFRKRPTRVLVVLFVGVAFFVQGIFYGFINNIEGYSQRAAVEFYQSKIGEDVYLQTVGFKSYAHLFYSRRRPDYPDYAKETDFLRSDSLDRTTYFIVRKEKDYRRLDSLSGTELELYKNGFYVVRRDPMRK